MVKPLCEEQSVEKQSVGALCRSSTCLGRHAVFLLEKSGFGLGFFFNLDSILHLKIERGYRNT